MIKIQMIDTGLNTIRLMFLKLIHIPQKKLKLKHLCLLSELVFSMFSFIIDFCPNIYKILPGKKSLIPQRLHRIPRSRPPTLPTYGQQCNSQRQQTGQGKYPPAQVGFVRKAFQPFTHGIICNWAGYYKGNRYPFYKVFI